MTPPLTLTTKLAYGVGELSSEITGSILVFFLLFFLTNVAGLLPSLAGGVLLVGKIWDALNDPIVGWLSDRTRSPLGRRYPWMLIGAIPLGIFFCLQWVVPPTSQQGWLFLYYSLIALLFYTAFTAVVVPYSTLAAELTIDYDSRTSLVSFKAAFSIGGSIVSLLIVQLLFVLVVGEKTQYMLLGAICGTLACLAAYLCTWGTYRRYQLIQAQRVRAENPLSVPVWQQIQVVLSNRPFLYVVGIYLCSWLGLQLSAAILPYFVVNWMNLEENHFTQMALTVQGTALLMMFFWSAVAQHLGKKTIYFLGIPMTLVAQAGLFFLQPGQVGLMYTLAAVAGAGLSTAYLVPWSMLPDVIDLDELNTGQRREGIFFGVVVLLQKIAVAIVLLIVGQILDWSGFIPATTSSPASVQPETALLAIRWLIGPIPSIVLIGGLVMVSLYPITRQVHGEILLKLSEGRKS
ncbi:MAG: MFS transporter [Symploca sp. SIO2D2]|nr:MFS transporter [Symploca sp. SIO2D2]